MNGMLTPREEHLTIALWEEHKSVEGYWEGIHLPEYHVLTIARKMEYLGIEYTRRFMKAIIVECRALHGQTHYLPSIVDMVLMDNHIVQMGTVVTSLSAIVPGDDGGLLKLLEAKQEFVKHYNYCLDHLDNLAIAIDQKIQPSDKHGTFLHSRAYLGTGDNTIMILQQQMFPTEEVLPGEVLPL